MSDKYNFNVWQCCIYHFSLMKRDLRNTITKRGPAKQTQHPIQSHRVQDKEIRKKTIQKPLVFTIKRESSELVQHLKTKSTMKINEKVASIIAVAPKKLTDLTKKITLEISNINVNATANDIKARFGLI